MQWLALLLKRLKLFLCSFLSSDIRKCCLQWCSAVLEKLIKAYYISFFVQNSYIWSTFKNFTGSRLQSCGTHYKIILVKILRRGRDLLVTVGCQVSVIFAIMGWHLVLSREIIICLPNILGTNNLISYLLRRGASK